MNGAPTELHVRNHSTDSSRKDLRFLVRGESIIVDRANTTSMVCGIVDKHLDAPVVTRVRPF
jgi:hypothetical protein